MRLNLCTNDESTLSFKIASAHPMAEYLKRGMGRVLVRKRDNFSSRYVFLGLPTKAVSSEDGTMTVECSGNLGLLKNTLFSRYLGKWIGPNGKILQQFSLKASVSDMINIVLAQVNQQFSGDMRISLRVCTATENPYGVDLQKTTNTGTQQEGLYITRKQDEIITTLDWFRNELIEKCEANVLFDIKGPNEVIIDVYGPTLPRSSAPGLVLGRNMTSLKRTINADKLFTVLLATGSSETKVIKQAQVDGDLDEVQEELDLSAIDQESLSNMMSSEALESSKYLDWQRRTGKTIFVPESYMTNDRTQVTFVLPDENGIENSGPRYVFGGWEDDPQNSANGTLVFKKINMSWPHENVLEYGFLSTADPQIFTIVDANDASNRTYPFGQKACQSIGVATTGQPTMSSNNVFKINDLSFIDPVAEGFYDSVTQTEESDPEVHTDGTITFVFKPPFIEWKEGIERFGRIVHNENWSSAKPSQLVKYAPAFFKKTIYSLESYEAEAIDMAYQDSSVPSMDIGYSYRIRSSKDGIDAWVPCQQMEIDLGSPQNNSLSLSYTYKPLTRIVRDIFKNVNYLERLRNRIVFNVQGETEDPGV